MTDNSAPNSLRKFWVDPETLPNAASDEAVAQVRGNAPDIVKRQCLNTFAAYGVGDDDCFASNVGKKVWFTTLDVQAKGKGKEATTVAEVIVDKSMANGNGMLHGGCMTYIIDNCCSTPLVVLGLIIKRNGVGVTQSMNVLFHSPASIGMHLQITSTALSLGKQTMTARCEVTDKQTGRLVASAFLSKMQPSRL